MHLRKMLWVDLEEDNFALMLTWKSNPPSPIPSRFEPSSRAHGAHGERSGTASTDGTLTPPPSLLSSLPSSLAGGVGTRSSLRIDTASLPQSDVMATSSHVPPTLEPFDVSRFQACRRGQRRTRQAGRSVDSWFVSRCCCRRAQCR